MPRRILKDILVVDRSTLACNMYQLLFSSINRFRVRFSDEFQSFFKKSRRMRPDLLIVNNNAFLKGAPLNFPSPTILITSRDRIDLREGVVGMKNVVLIEKPFYPYDLISIASRLMTQPPEQRRGRRRKPSD